MDSRKVSAAVMVVLIAVVMAATTTDAQIPSCASKLIPCAEYLNSTNPPASCCDPLKEAVSKELSCLCGLFNDPELLKSFGINVTQAMNLPRACGIPGDINACNNAMAPGPSHSSLPPPATPGGGGGGNDGNGVGRIATSGLMFLTTALFMLW